MFVPKMSNEEKATITLNDLIDYLIEMNGLNWVIRYLHNDEDWSEEDFEEMQFSKNDVLNALEEADEEEFDNQDVQNGG